MATTLLPNSREFFSPIEADGVEGYTHRSFLNPKADWVELANTLDKDPGTLLRQGGGQGITSLCDVEGRSIYCKRYVPSRFRRRFRDAMGFLRSLDEWKSNVTAAKMGIHSATVLASFSVKRSRFSIYHYFLTEPVRGVDFYERLNKAEADGEDKAPILDDLGSFVAWLHYIGFYHAHLNVAHIFQTELNDFYLIDLEHAFIQSPLPAWYVQNNLKQLRKSLKKCTSASDVRLFEESYRGWTPSPAGRYSSDAVRRWQPAGR